MTPVSRRRFLTSSSIGVALAGALAAVPGLGALLRIQGRSASSIAGWGAEPLIAHVRDLNSGEISILVGTEQVVRRDVDLATRLYQAAGRGR